MHAYVEKQECDQDLSHLRRCQAAFPDAYGQLVRDFERPDSGDLDPVLRGLCEKRLRHSTFLIGKGPTESYGTVDDHCLLLVIVDPLTPGSAVPT